MDGIDEFESQIKQEKKKVKRKIQKVEKGKSPIGTAIVVLIIVVAGLFVAWYYPRIGQPVWGWTEDQTLTDQYKVDFPTDMSFEYVVLVDGQMDANSSYVQVYSREMNGFFLWNPWILEISGYYDTTDSSFHFI